MRLLVFLASVALLWRTCISQIDYCDTTDDGGDLRLILVDGPLNLFLGAPQPVCIGCIFTVGVSGSLQPSTVYEISKGGGAAMPLAGVDGVTVNDNGTLFVEDASAIFDVGDDLRCTFMSTIHISPIVALIFNPPTLDPSGIVDVTEGDNLTLSCQDPGNSDDAITYQWFNDSNGMDVTDPSITPPVPYTITNIQREASGDYSCVLTDDDIPNTTPTSTVTVNVQYPPLISSIAPINIVSPRTTTVSITCVYDGNPDPVVSWVRGMDLLDDAFSNVTITTTSTESTLTLSNIQPSDGGNYRCITNNTIGPGNIDGSIGGYASDNATLVVQVAPNPVGSIMIQDITNTSFTVQWTYPTGEGADGGATITGVTVTYTAIDNNASPSDDTMNVNYPGTSLSISSLEPLTEYRVSVVVNNEVFSYVGSSTAVDETVYTLSNILDPPMISSVVAESSTALRVNWTAPRDSFLETEHDTYRIRYQETGTNSEVMEQYVRHPTMTALITGLKKGTNYTVTVAVNNTAGFSFESDDGVGTTDVDPPTMPTNFVQFLYPDSICIEWEEPDDNGGSDIIGYQAQINGNTTSLGATTRRFLFQNLMNDTMYNVGVAADSSGINTLGEYAEMSVTTPSDFPEESGFTVRVTDRAPFDVVVRWNVTTTNDRFKLQYKESDDADWNATVALDGSVMMYKINGLEPEIEYDVRVIRVESDSCVQRASAIERFTTPEIMLDVNINDDDMTGVSAGDSIVLSCNLTTGGRAPEVEWTYNGGPLPSVATVDEDNQLVLTELTTNNSGNYTCTVRNATFSFSLNVAPTPAPITEVLPLWAIIVIAVGAALCILIFVVVLIIVCRYVCCNKDKNKTHYDLNRRSKGDVWVDEGGSGFAPSNPGYRASIEAVDNPYESAEARPRTLTNLDTTTTSFAKTGSREQLTEKSKDGVEYVPVTSSTFQSNAKQQTDV